MPKKKKEDDAGEYYLGRPKGNVKMGILGLPNVGKSTMFNVLADMQVPAENFPFCTIDPSKAQVEVQDKRLDFLTSVYKPKKKVNACLTVWDIAGLIKGAHEGDGLGNEFLSNIAGVDALYHVIRAFSAKKVTHVDGDVNPIRDIGTIRGELIAKDLQLVEKEVEKRKKLVERTNDKQLKEEFTLVQRIHEMLKENKEVRHVKWQGKDIDFINSLNLFTAKNIVYLVNVSEKNWIQGSNKWIQPIKDHLKTTDPDAKILPFSAKFEAKVHELGDDAARKKYLKEVKAKSAVKKIINAGYEALNLMNYFTAGEDECKAWTIRKGWKAPQAAGVIHTDFTKGFICAEVFAFEEFKKAGTLAALKAAGKYRQEGRNYVVNDGDVMLFKGNGF